MARMSALLLSVVIGCLAAPLAYAHEGHFYPDVFSTVNASSILVAQCSTWKAPVAAGAQPASLVDSTGAATGPVTVTGNVKMYASLKYDCAGQYQTTVEPNVTFVRAGGAPLAGVEVQGFTMTGTCAQGGGERYAFDASMDVEELDNLLFINAFNTTDAGVLAGITRQDHMIATGGANGPKSFMWVYDGTENGIACCDLVVAAPGTNYTASLVGKGQACAPPAPSAHGSAGAHGSAAPAASSAADSTTTTDMPAAATATATSGAASAAASAAMVLMAAAAPMLMLMA